MPEPSRNTSPVAPAPQDPTRGAQVLGGETTEMGTPATHRADLAADTAWVSMLLPRRPKREPFA